MLQPTRAREGGTALLIVALLALPAAARGWGDEVHRLVNEKATATLPAPLEGLFAGNVAFLRAHSVDPDDLRGDDLPGCRAPRSSQILF